MESTFEVQHHTSVQCVCHLHPEAEFVLVTNGVLHVVGINCETVLNAGEALYIMPFEIHGFRTAASSQCTILIFPADLVPDFAVTHPLPQPFSPSVSLITRCTSLDPDTPYDLLHSRAVLYPLCCEILDNCPHTESGYTEVSTINRIERYIWNHIDSPLSLETVAAAMGLNLSYLSRMFHQNKGIRFSEYVNMLRCYQAVRLLGNADSLSMSEIAYEVGFESIRTFNRVFLRHYGITPSKMKQHKAASIPQKRTIG